MLDIENLLTEYIIISAKHKAATILKISSEEQDLITKQMFSLEDKLRVAGVSDAEIKKS